MPWSNSLLILFRPQEDDIHETSDQGPNPRTPSENGLSTLPVDIQREISTEAPEGLTGDSTADHLIGVSTLTTENLRGDSTSTTDHLRGDSTLTRDNQRVAMALKQDTSGSKTQK